MLLTVRYVVACEFFMWIGWAIVLLFCTFCVPLCQNLGSFAENFFRNKLFE
jgi:hypothetical protein